MSLSDSENGATEALLSQNSGANTPSNSSPVKKVQPPITSLLASLKPSTPEEYASSKRSSASSNQSSSQKPAEITQRSEPWTDAPAPSTEYTSQDDSSGAMPISDQSSKASFEQQPKWAYSHNRNSLPLRQGPYLDVLSKPDTRRAKYTTLARPESVVSQGYGSAQEDNMSEFSHNRDSFMPRHSAIFMLPQAEFSKGSIIGDDTPSIIPRSQSQTPAFTRVRDSVASSTGGTAAAREAAVAAGYTSPKVKDAPVLSPSQQFNDYAPTELPSSESQRYTSKRSRRANAVAAGDYDSYNKEHYDPEAARKRSGGILSGWRKWGLLALLALIALAVGLGAGLGIGLNKKSNTHNNAAQSGSSGSGQQGSGSNINYASPNTTTPAGLTALPAWNWTDSEKKVYGVNIGGQFLLERWLFEDWMTQVGGENAYDEWTMSQNLGQDKMRDVLNEHMATWFKESDMDSFQKAGINMIRIPIGYWPFLSTSQTNEPYVNASQLDYLSVALNWAWQRKMYVLVDLHGLPGSQNGDQSSGHNMSLSSTGNNDVPWFTTANQDLSKTAVTNMLNWLSNHPARSVISGVTTVNEPQTNAGNTTRVSILKSFYTWSINAASKFNMPVILHHGFVTNPYTYWDDYMSDQDPSMVIFDDHPYPAWYQTPEPTNQTAITQNICTLGDDGKNFPVPVLMGEWSAVNDVNQTDFTSQYINTQLNTYGWSGGSMFFNFRVNTSQHPVIGPPANIGLTYSLLDMLPAANSVGQFPTYNGSVSVQDFTSSLLPSCGKTPSYSWTT
ncbi:hypothetical protein MPSI1_002465 [Malassezia psittaci]|uniref:glucan 1,3-beta-glucosidase n=1 Tax=Malassezia psittaci TaxID=1821823 RepID=A0AAF0JL24_9BASI|nr:hypothetical protein MPSI1_002465 [Malassezia psittaci]